RLTGDEPHVTGGLTQPEQRFQRREHAAARGEPLDDVLLRRGTDRVVDGALRLVELDVEERVGARRELRQDVALVTAQHERPNPLPQAPRSGALAAREGLGEA